MEAADIRELVIQLKRRKSKLTRNHIINTSSHYLNNSILLSNCPIIVRAIEGKHCSNIIIVGCSLPASFNRGYFLLYLFNLSNRPTYLPACAELTQNTVQS